MHFQTAREQPRPSLSTELGDRPSGPMGRVDYPRQVVREPLHPQATPSQTSGSGRCSPFSTVSSSSAPTISSGVRLVLVALGGSRSR
jgi:hypothetical protein